jgi:hypothetical protein
VLDHYPFCHLMTAASFSHSMTGTLRTQNHCTDCGYTWLPKGKNLPPKCPDCDSANVTHINSGYGLLFIIGLTVVLWGVSKHSGTSESSLDGAPTTPAIAQAAPEGGSQRAPAAQTSSPAPIAEQLTAERQGSSAFKLSASQQAHQEALRRYPQLGIAGSPLNREFLARYKRYRQERGDYFNDPSWPLRLAEESFEATARPNSADDREFLRSTYKQ